MVFIYQDLWISKSLRRCEQFYETFQSLEKGNYLKDHYMLFKETLDEVNHKNMHRNDHINSEEIECLAVEGKDRGVRDWGWVWEALYILYFSFKIYIFKLTFLVFQMLTPMKTLLFFLFISDLIYAVYYCSQILVILPANEILPSCWIWECPCDLLWLWNVSRNNVLLWELPDC